jgi:hypothetical protein
MATMNNRVADHAPPSARGMRKVAKRSSSGKTGRKARGGSAVHSLTPGRKQVHGRGRATERFVSGQSLKTALICTSLALVAGAGVWLGRLWLRRDLQSLFHRIRLQ